MSHSPSFPDVLTIEAHSGPIRGSVRPPGSKSYTNRALLLAGLAEGASTLEGALFSDDTWHMARALMALGIPVTPDETRQRFDVTGGGGRIPSPRASVSVGNSGTSARFLTPVLALGHGVYELDGNEAMRKRPISPLLDALASMGVRAKSLHGNGCPPVQVEASGLEGGHVRMAGGISSQYFSALLMAGPCTRHGITIDVEGDLVSKPYIDVTAQTMQAFGVALENRNYQSFAVRPGTYKATAYAIEPDASAASYFFAAAAVTGGCVSVPGLGTSSLQGDLGFVRVLERMGCTIRQNEHETEVTGPKQLVGVDVDMSNISDTAQTLAAIAPFADRPTRVTGIGFIRRKETDRVGAVVAELQRLGIRVEEESDGFVVHPGRPKPATIKTYDDHRMAMSFAITGLATGGLKILDPGCVSKTFPAFFDVLATLRRG